MFCPKCGKDVGESKFCPECGTPASNSDVSPEESLTQTSENVENESAVPEENKQDLYYDALKKIEDEKANAKKAKNRKKAIGCGAILLVVLLAVIIFAAVNSKKDKSDSPVKVSISVIDNNNTDNTDSTQATQTQTTTETTTEANKTWFLEHYVDDFKEEVEEWWFIEGDFYGSFSNSATTNSDCFARVFYDYNKRFGVFLYDYGRSQVKNNSSRNSVIYNVKYKDSKGNVKETTAYIPKSGDRLYFENYESLLDALKSGDVSVNLVEQGREIHSYNFKMTSDNFADLYNQQNK